MTTVLKKRRKKMRRNNQGLRLLEFRWVEIVS
jgi:hypothetical protein